ncbi:MAG TPA: Gmad2 immunoglobulin-like domain-containing protein [Verrucomicrobiae bacterium]|nr:Gmad2 immunoglobulin-like domain-containing protein [Verrucomicrobiae bacterium]
MTTMKISRLLAILVATVALAACNTGTGPLGTVPAASTGPEPSVVQGSPDVTPEPSVEPSDEPSVEPSGSTSPSPSTGTTGTTIVRAYFWLGGDPGTAGLVAVLRTVPGTKAVASAAMNALLAGPTSAEGGREITTAVPDGSQLLGLTIKDGVATVDLSSEFESGGGSASVLTRLGQVVYTLTQFPSVKSVLFQIEGKTVTVFGSEGVTLDGPVGRADYVQLLPAIWVDRPAYGAAIGNPAHVTGSADVFEATFRISILDGSGKVIADQQVMATCGSGCRGTFDTTIAYNVTKAQYGTLHVYEPSAKDGSPVNVRDYRVWLTPKG